jgi:hypothetical protein
MWGSCERWYVFTWVRGPSLKCGDLVRGGYVFPWVRIVFNLLNSYSIDLGEKIWWPVNQPYYVKTERKM